jgi:ADP-ribose pyrophosphatase YjhB (NUDIX family)
MRYGISAAGIIAEDDKVLMAHHVEPDYDFWTLPGGRLEGDESVFDCVRREMAEETGLAVELDRIVYIQEFVEPDYHFCKFFILCSGYSGNLTIDHKPEGESHLVGVRFLSGAEIKELEVYPEVLHDEFWNDQKDGFPETKYLGLQRVDP